SAFPRVRGAGRQVSSAFHLKRRRPQPKKGLRNPQQKPPPIRDSDEPTATSGGAFVPAERRSARIVTSSADQLRRLPRGDIDVGCLRASPRGRWHPGGRKVWDPARGAKDIPRPRSCHAPPCPPVRRTPAVASGVRTASRQGPRRQFEPQPCP